MNPYTIALHVVIVILATFVGYSTTTLFRRINRLEEELRKHT